MKQNSFPWKMKLINHLSKAIQMLISIYVSSRIDEEHSTKGNGLSLEWANTKENMELVDTSTDTMIVGAKDVTNEDAFKIWDRNDDVEIDLENVNDNADDDLI